VRCALGQNAGEVAIDEARCVAEAVGGAKHSS